MNKQPNHWKKLSASLMCFSLLAACSNGEDVANTSPVSAAKSDAPQAAVLAAYEESDYYTAFDGAATIKLQGDSATYDGSGKVSIEGTTVTINEAGTYIIEGTLADGGIVVDTDDEEDVRLVLNGANIQSSSTSPLYVKQAEKTIISLAEGSENSLSDAARYAEGDTADSGPDAALFSKDDLTINGSGTLTVEGNYNNGITGKDELKITGGTIRVTAADDGIMGRDLLAVKDGSITIKAKGDGMKSTNDQDADKGNVAIEGGMIQIEAGDDGIQAENSLQVSDGNLTIVSGGGSALAEDAVSDEDLSGKALKANQLLALTGGFIKADSSDDTLHSDNAITISGGELHLTAGDDAIHADQSVEIVDGTIDIDASYEGIEGSSIAIGGGDITVHAEDDGINISSDDDKEAPKSDNERLLTITGGNVYVDADGDGLDANGSIRMSGGAVTVDGPTNNGNGALDYDGEFTISGGTLIAAGSNGMAMGTSESSEQPAVIMSFSQTQKAGTAIRLNDQDGKEILTATPQKNYQSVVISSPELQKDHAYTLYSEAGQVEFTVSDSVTWLNEDGVTTGGSGGMHGPEGKGDRQGPPEGMGKPEGAQQREDLFSGLDEETRQSAQDILNQMQEGTLSKEEAQNKLKALGVELPQRNGPPCAPLTLETTDQACIRCSGIPTHAFCMSFFPLFRMFDFHLSLLNNENRQTLSASTIVFCGIQIHLGKAPHVRSEANGIYKSRTAHRIS